MINMEFSKDELVFLETALDIALDNENLEDYATAFEALLNRVERASKSLARAADKARGLA